MPFCPKCKAEYEFGIAKCADCEIPLFGALTVGQPADNSDPDKPNETEPESSVVYLCTVDNEIEAIILRDLLKQAGIESSCQEKTFTQYPTTLYPNYTSLGINDIMVLDKDYEAAKTIADDYFKSIEAQEKDKKPEEEEA
jgi:hypothetical protein